jgi:hypothetical protein
VDSGETETHLFPPSRKTDKPRCVVGGVEGGGGSSPCSLIAMHAHMYASRQAG